MDRPSHDATKILKARCHNRTWFTQVGMWLDFVIIPVSFITEAFPHLFSDRVQEADRFLILLRLWRLARIFTGLFVHMSQFENIQKLEEELEEEMDYALFLLEKSSVKAKA